MTYSILGRETGSGALGVAVQSKFPGVGTIVPHGRAGVGCIATQAFASPHHGTVILDLLERGATPDEAVAIALRGDNAADERQLAVLSAGGRSAAHTGPAIGAWQGASGAVPGAESLAVGNSLAHPTVLEAMTRAFETTTGELASRLIEALRAGRDAGGEIRGQQSAAVAVWAPAGGYGGQTGRTVDISVYDHPEPIEELARCYALHRLSYFPSNPDSLTPIADELARELKRLLHARGFNVDPENSTWDDAAIAALKRFMGMENYDNRLRDDAWIDQEVLDDLRARYQY